MIPVHINDNQRKKIVDLGRKGFNTAIHKRQRIKISSRICYGLAVVSLIVGASFHGYRIHPENVEHYNIGVTMGIAMIIVFIIFLVAGILLTFLEKRKFGMDYK